MPTPAPLRRQLTPRDLELFGLLDRHPFTTDQLLRLSQTFPEPFTHERLLRRRLQQLREAGWLLSWPLSTISRGGSPHYWKMTRDGYRLLHGEEVGLPHRRTFETLAPGHHHHTQALGEFLVQTFVCAEQQGTTIQHFARENSVELKAAGFTVRPDCAFQLVTPEGRTYHFCVELDNGTERIRSQLDTESLERKIRGYDAHQAQFGPLDPSRYLVLFVTTRSVERLRHILSLAALVMQNPQRTVFVGVDLATYVANDPFRAASLTDHRGLKRMLVPRTQPTTVQRSRQVQIATRVS
jgi:hypothetical protein